METLQVQKVIPPRKKAKLLEALSRVVQSGAAIEKWSVYWIIKKFFGHKYGAYRPKIMPSIEALIELLAEPDIPSYHKICIWRKLRGYMYKTGYKVKNFDDIATVVALMTQADGLKGHIVIPHLLGFYEGNITFDDVKKLTQSQTSPLARYFVLQDVLRTKYDQCSDFLSSESQKETFASLVFIDREAFEKERKTTRKVGARPAYYKREILRFFAEKDHCK